MNKVRQANSTPLPKTQNFTQRTSSIVRYLSALQCLRGQIQRHMPRHSYELTAQETDRYDAVPRLQV